MTEHFDNRIREQLADYAPVVPSHIWENIANRKKKKRGFLWFWLGSKRKPILIAGLLLLTGLIITDVAIIQKQSDSIRNRAASADAAGENKKQNAGRVISDRDRESAESPTESGRADEKSPSKDLMESSKSNVAEKAKNASVNKNAVEESGSRTSLYPEISASAKNSKNIKTATAGMEAFSISAPTEKIRKRNPRKNRSTFVQDAAIGIMEDEISGGTETTEAIPESKEAYSRTPENFSFMMRKTPAAWNPRYSGMATGTIPCPEDVAAANKKYLEFYIGPDHTIRNYRDTANSEYLHRRKESTSNALAFSAGVRFTKVFNNAMSVRTGVNYSLITEKFEVADGNVIKVIYILDNNNDTIGNYSTRVNIYRTTYNKYHSLDIPLTIGYEFGNGNLHGNMNAGIIANIYSWQQGATLDESFKSVSITTGGPASPYQFKTNMGLSFAAAMSLYYRFENRIQLMAEPYIRYSLSPANKEEITLRQKFHTLGLRLGIRYDLNKIIE